MSLEEFFHTFWQLTMRVGGSQNVDSGKFSCTNYTSFIPYKGYAVLQTRDAGDPKMIMLKPTGLSILPREILVKRMNGIDSEWTKFDPSKGVRDSQGSLIIPANNSKPISSWVSDRFLPSVIRADKQYAIEFLKAASTR
jgi:hypothetical protein